MRKFKESRAHPGSTRSGCAREIIPKRFKDEFQMVTEMRQQSPTRQMFGYFGTIAMVVIVVAALCWGFVHI
jgi:hypothetical protein